MQTGLHNLSTFAGRLKQYIDFKHIASVNKFAKLLNYDSSEKIARLFRDTNNSPSYEILTDIANKFDDLNIDWLICGRGEMIKSTPNFLGRFEDKTTPKTTPIGTPNVVSIPIVDIVVAAGHGATNGANLDVLDHIQMPAGLVKKGTHLCARIKGDSMAPTLQDGGYIVLRLLEKGEWKKQKDEHIYAVTTRDGLAYLKRLKLRFSQGFVVCRSDSPDKSSYPSFNIQADEINTLWYAEWYFTAKMPNIHDQYYQRLQHLEDDVEELKAQFKRING